MTDHPITPTRIIPAGAPLPGRPPEPGELPPWWEQPAPPLQPPPSPVPAAEPEPRPLQVYVTVQTEPYYEEREPTRWERLWSAVRRLGRPWQICGALTLALLPVPGTAYSAATTWAYAVSQARDTWGQGSGYTLALTPLAIALIRISHSGGTVPRLLLLAVALVGVTGAIHAYDPITWITGVHPS